MSLARGARLGGARIAEGVTVTGNVFINCQDGVRILKPATVRLMATEALNDAGYAVVEASNIVSRIATARRLSWGSSPSDATSPAIPHMTYTASASDATGASEERDRTRRSQEEDDEEQAQQTW